MDNKNALYEHICSQLFGLDHISIQTMMYEER